MNEQQITSPITVFYSYAHEDESLRNDLNKHLSGLRRRGIITEWHDRQIVAGAKWADTIDTHLDMASVILLLVSPDFLASDYCFSIEMKRALERQREGSACVIPVILRPVYWRETPFADLQCLPRDAKPVTSWSNPDDAFLDIVNGIRNAIERLDTKVVRCVWNVPYSRNPYFTGREDLLLHLVASLKTGQATVLTQAQAISGLGGIGKTQVAVEYAHRYQNTYHFILWVNAASHEALIADFVALANVLQLPEKKESDHNVVIANVKRWLATHRDWLLIFDNADDIAIIRNFLPTEGGGHILLTTRAQAVGLIAHSLRVEIMKKEEGMLLLLRRAKLLEPSTSLDLASKEDRAEAEAIVIELGSLPLALDQAGAYIEETQCSLSEYLTLYRKRRKVILRRRSSLPSDHPEPVATTWKLSFQKVKQANSITSDLLCFCAFLASDSIPEELLIKGASVLGSRLKHISSDPFLLSNAFEELCKYSLIQRNREIKTLSMHRLVQEVLKDDMSPKMQRLWAERIVKAVHFAFSPKEGESTINPQLIMPHVQICSEMIKTYRFLFPEAAELLYEAGDYWYEYAKYKQAESFYQQALALYAVSPGSGHLYTAYTLNELATVYRAQGKYKQAESHYLRALDIKETTLGPDHYDTATTLHALATLYRVWGKYEQAESLCQRALDIYKTKQVPEHLYTAPALNELATLSQARGKYEQAELLYQRALHIYEANLGFESSYTAATWYSLAMLYQMQGKYVQAEPLYQRAFHIYENTLGVEHPSTITALHQLTTLYQIQAKQGPVEQFYQNILPIQQKMLGAKHPSTATTLHQLAALYRGQEKYEQAESLLLQALDIRKEVLGHEHPGTASTLHALAVLYRNQEKYEQAESLLLQALDIRKEMLGHEHPDTASTLQELAVLYRNQEKYEQAEFLFFQVLHIRKAVLGPEHPDTTSTLRGLGKLYQAQSRYSQAESLYLQALEIRKRALGSEHPRTARTILDLATLYQLQNKYEQAEIFYQQAFEIKEKALGAEHPDMTNLLTDYLRLLEEANIEMSNSLIRVRALKIREHLKSDVSFRTDIIEKAKADPNPKPPKIFIWGSEDDHAGWFDMW